MEAIAVSEKTTSNGLLLSDLLTTREPGYSTLINRNQPGKAVGNDSEKSLERRGHPRYQIQKNAFAFIRARELDPIRIKGVGMGEIAAAVFRCHPACLGRVKNVSLGGLTFRHVDNPDVEPNKAYVLDILIVDCGIYLANLSFQVIADVETGDDFLSDPLQTRQICVQFENLSCEQFSKLEALIQNCSCGEA